MALQISIIDVAKKRNMASKSNNHILVLNAIAQYHPWYLSMHEVAQKSGESLWRTLRRGIANSKYQYSDADILWRMISEISRLASKRAANITK